MQLNYEKNPKFYSSKAAEELFLDPEKSLEFLSYLPKSVIQKAYNLRKTDLTYDNFIKELENYTVSA